MNYVRRVFVLCYAATIVLYGAAVRGEQQPSACVLCHEFKGAELGRPVTEWKGSIHQQNGITCAFCHGGNPGVDVRNLEQLSVAEFGEKRSQAMSASRGFIGKPTGGKLFDLCGRCHAASVDRYAKSIMGKAYLENRGGPSCILCHQAHRNSMPEVPKVCESCHNDTTGFDQIDPMDVTESTVKALSGIRIKFARTKTAGKRPPFIPALPRELGAFQTGLIAFGAVLFLFGIGYLVYVLMERRK